MNLNVNWQRAALNIQNTGMPLVRASRIVGRNPGWLSQIARGEVSKVELTDAVNLLDLHVDLCGPEKTAELRL